MNALTSPASDLHTTSLSDQTIACLQFFNRWETPLDHQAHKAYGRIRHDAPDF
jgi:hypothetical protein